MTRGAVIRRWPKTADAAAITARETLQHALGLGKKVREVSRSEVFAFTWESEAPGATAALEALARDTNLAPGRTRDSWPLQRGFDRYLSCPRALRPSGRR